ncbi:MAG: RNA-directed DNA polymerase [Steroidobacteraceae bacterium]
MTLKKSSIEWAIDFVSEHSDGDLFPKLPEMTAIVSRKSEFSNACAGQPLATLLPGVCRRFIVPKDEVSYRQATQLDPQDSIVLSATVFEFGAGIEQRRLPNDQVFSYRFNPSHPEGLYGGHSAWNDFWTKAASKASSSGSVLHCDIADFYNQIYHHAVENQLGKSGLPNEAIKWIIKLLESTTAGVSRGVPVGPHAIHLIAEATLVPIDNSLVQAGIDFIRYADDIIVFCDDTRTAQRTLARIAAILDRQQRLMLQRHKTKIYRPEEFCPLCALMIQDRPINKEEADLLKIVRKYSGGNPYRTITYNQIEPADWNLISKNVVSKVIREYLSQSAVDYIRLRWFYRRLSQIGHPGALEVTLQNIHLLGPCFANICFYLASIQTLEGSGWPEIGSQLLKLLESEDVRDSEYFRLSMLSLFGRNAQLNHFARIRQMYQMGDPFVRREVILAAAASGAYDWVRELKESFGYMDPWQKYAFVYAASGLPADEKQYFLARQSFVRPFDVELAKWSRTL